MIDSYDIQSMEPDRLYSSAFLLTKTLFTIRRNFDYALHDIFFLSIANNPVILNRVKQIFLHESERGRENESFYRSCDNVNKRKIAYLFLH